MADHGNHKEPSHILHSIMKASISIKKFNKDTLSEFQSAVEEKFGINLVINSRIVYPKGTAVGTVLAIQRYYKDWAVEQKL